MNRLPELKKFLKEGEAESYHNVEVNYIPGRKAVLKIYEDDNQLEEIILSELKTREEMHELMVSKGFVVMEADDEYDEDDEEDEDDEDDEDDDDEEEEGEL